MWFLRGLRTPVYQNTGSVARDHLAPERTFLSWLRTGLGFIALGIAVERFNQLDLVALLDPSSLHRPDSTAPSTRAEVGSDPQPKMKEHLLVGSLLGTGSGSIAFGTTRYFSNMRMLERGLFKPAYLGAMGLSIAVSGLAGAVYVEALREKKGKK